MHCEQLSDLAYLWVNSTTAQQPRGVRVSGSKRKILRSHTLSYKDAFQLSVLFARVKPSEIERIRKIKNLFT